MPQRGELALAQRLPWATLLAQRMRPGEDDMSCTVEQHSLSPALAHSLYSPVWHLQVVFALGGLQNDWLMPGK